VVEDDDEEEEVEVGEAEWLSTEDTLCTPRAKVRMAYQGRQIV
jgi:hypothetical protein